MKNIRKKLENIALFDKIIILAFLFGIIFFAYFFFRKQDFVTVTVKVGEDAIRYEEWVATTGTRTWFEQLFKPGMEETDGLGRAMAELVSVYSYDTEPSRKAVYLNLNLRAIYNRTSGQHSFKGRALLVGSPIRLNLDGLYIEGLVTGVQGVDDTRKREDIIVSAQVVVDKKDNVFFLETTGTSESIEKALNIGDEVKDSGGNVVIKIIDKKVEDAKRSVTTSDGRIIVARNPLRKDVFLTLKINAIKTGDRYYVFDDIPILIGNTIPLNTPTLFVEPEVTKIEVSKTE